MRTAPTSRICACGLWVLTALMITGVRAAAEDAAAGRRRVPRLKAELASYLKDLRRETDDLRAL